MNAAIIAIIVLAVALAGALPFMLRGRHAPVDGARQEPIEDEIARYRAAVRAETLCARCGQANPGGSKFCHECGRTLPRVDAQEFDGTDVPR